MTFDSLDFKKDGEKETFFSKKFNDLFNEITDFLQLCCCFFVTYSRYKYEIYKYGFKKSSFVLLMTLCCNFVLVI